MSTNEEERPAVADPLLAALRALPPPTLDGAHDARAARDARAAYERSFAPSTWHGPPLGLASRLAMPVFLAGVVALYMTWAIGAASALVH